MYIVRIEKLRLVILAGQLHKIGFARFTWSFRKKKANNINLVTAGHYLPIVIESIKRARKSGLTIPIVYNSSGYEKVEAIEALDGIVDIFLPDF